jgi:CDP-2,3-bis-(O-geranylgeranyl)-sn-glycerol synthase
MQRPAPTSNAEYLEINLLQDQASFMVNLQLLILVGVSNGAPILADYLFQQRFATPLDFGRCFIDGRPLFGRSKTHRGIIAALMATGLASAAMGLTIESGVVIGVGAMTGDLLSSFLKRRLGIAPSGMALGLDQIPEVLLPLLLVKGQFALTYDEILKLSLLFLVFELLISRILFRLRIRKQPY